MPTYTYRCTKCGYRFDQFQHFADDPLEICPNCQEIALRKVYQPVGIVFKGKGFYATDNRSPSGMASQKLDSGDHGSSNASDKTASTETAPKTADKPVSTETPKEKTATPTSAS
ncbi:MAG: FmdB family zinc ribbon protein [Anaerolineaceae bacterium]